MVADWHALMSEYESPGDIKRNVISCVVDWISCGLDPDKCTIFVQSDVPGHLELSMALACLTPLSWLERCPTYKEQLREMEKRDLTTYAFLGYPVLQAADIMVYKANAVPVGVDQSAHLELTREIVRRFNHLYGEVFPEPETLLTRSPKLLGIDSRKMSKSYGNYIALSDTPDDIVSKTKKMFTDPKRIYKKDKGHPDKCNIHSYYQVFDPNQAGRVAKACRNAEVGCAECKKKLAEVLIERLKPIREKRQELINDRQQVFDILADGADKAIEVTSKTMEEVRQKVGLL